MRGRRRSFPPSVKPLVLALLSLLLIPAAFASVSIRRDDKKTLDVAIVKEPLSAAVKALEIHLPQPVEMTAESDPDITFRAKHVTAVAALNAVALEAGMAVVDKGDRFVVVEPHTPGVTMDVKDTDVHVILKTMQEQCGIKNLVVDPDVHGNGTFLFHDVPCRDAFDVVFRSLGLSSVIYPNSVVTVSAKH